MPRRALRALLLWSRIVSAWNNLTESFSAPKGIESIATCGHEMIYDARHRVSVPRRALRALLQELLDMLGEVREHVSVPRRALRALLLAPQVTILTCG